MADSSNVNSSDDVLKQIMEQTSNLAEGEPTTEGETQEFEVQGETTTETVGEQTEETSSETTEEETERASETEGQVESPYRIKYKGKDIEIPPEKVRDYLQKGYRVEEKLKELNEKEKAVLSQAEQMQTADISKLNEDFVRQLQENPIGTLMQFTKMVTESAEQERRNARKFDKAFEREMSATIPHWDAIQEGYRDHREEGHDHKTAVALAERDLFATMYLESKQKGVQEGEQKAALKLKAVIPGGNKTGGAVNGTSSVKDLKSMTSDEIAKAAGLRITKNSGW